MNLRAILRSTSLVIGLVGLAMASAVPVGWLMGEPILATEKMAICSILPLAMGGAGWLWRPVRIQLSARDGYLVVVTAWLGAFAVGALPYVWIQDMSWADAVFESGSGFTTAGSSVLSDIEALPAGLLYWRAMTHWLGGMGIVILAIAILPVLGIGGMNLYKASSPGPSQDRLTPRISAAAKQLWVVYVLLTVAETLLLVADPSMSLFDAWCHACATISTGGFSTKNASVAAFDSPYVEWVIIAFMAASGVNFAIYVRALFHERGQAWWRDEELRFFLIVIVGSVASMVVMLQLQGFYVESRADSVRHAAFAVVSVVTCTGFGTEDFDLWPGYCRHLLVLLMIMGGCVGSTSGGMKAMRVLVFLRSVLLSIKRNLYPRMVANVSFNQTRVSETVVDQLTSYCLTYLCVIMLVSLTLTVIEPGLRDRATDDGQSTVVTAISAAATTLGGVGPGLGAVGPHRNFGWMTAPSKWLLVLNMLLGRLELYTLFVVCMPSFWRQ